MPARQASGEGVVSCQIYVALCGISYVAWRFLHLYVLRDFTPANLMEEVTKPL